jgi:uncharacterized protein YecE (DUF72 family)
VQLADALQRVPSTADAWCIFDNTASGAALENAWQLAAILNEERPRDLSSTA